MKKKEVCKCHCHKNCPGSLPQQVRGKQAMCLCLPMECEHCKYPEELGTVALAIVETGSKVLMRAFIAAQRKQAKKEVLDFLENNGHGGGNWRRLIIQLKAREGIK